MRPTREGNRLEEQGGLPVCLDDQGSITQGSTAQEETKGEGQEVKVECQCMAKAPEEDCERWRKVEF